MVDIATVRVSMHEIVQPFGFKQKVCAGMKARRVFNYVGRGKLKHGREVEERSGTGSVAW